MMKWEFTKNYFLILLLYISPSFAQSVIPFVKVSCLEKKSSLCSDSSVLKIYVRRFERECIKRDGVFKIDQSCDQKSFYSSYCGIEGHNFQIHYSPKFYNLKTAQKHCQDKRIGPHALKWFNKP
jgi:hypothetical protein